MRLCACLMLPPIERSYPFVGMIPLTAGQPLRTERSALLPHLRDATSRLLNQLESVLCFCYCLICDDGDGDD